MSFEVQYVKKIMGDNKDFIYKEDDNNIYIEMNGCLLFTYCKSEIFNVYRYLNFIPKENSIEAINYNKEMELNTKPY